MRRIFAMLLALVALAAVAVPAATANGTRPIELSLELDNADIFDHHLTEACGTVVTAVISGVWHRKVFPGEAAHERASFDGNITWLAEATGKTYSSALSTRERIDYPEGIGIGMPARITSTGRHGGVFPLGSNPPPGKGTLVYDAIVIAVDDTGVPYPFAVGEPISMKGNFERETERICAALA